MIDIKKKNKVKKEVQVVKIPKKEKDNGNQFAWKKTR